LPVLLIDAPLSLCASKAVPGAPWSHARQILNGRADQPLGPGTLAARYERDGVFGADGGAAAAARACAPEPSH